MGMRTWRIASALLALAVPAIAGCGSGSGSGSGSGYSDSTPCSVLAATQSVNPAEAYVANKMGNSLPRLASSDLVPGLDVNCACNRGWTVGQAYNDALAQYNSDPQALETADSLMEATGLCPSDGNTGSGNTGSGNTG